MMSSRILQCFYDQFRIVGQGEAYTMITPEFEEFRNRVSIWGSISGQCEACLNGTWMLNSIGRPCSPIPPTPDTSPGPSANLYAKAQCTYEARAQ